MSRFNTPKALLTPPREWPQIRPTELRPKLAPAAPGPSRRVAHDPGTASLILSPPRADSTLFQQIGFVVLCVLFLSGYANELAIRYFHVKAYISTVSWVLLPLLLLASGNALRGLRDVMGRLWLFFCIWIVLAVPFSVWRGGSVDLLVTYIPHAWLQLFYFAGFAISVRHCRRLLLVLIASNLLLLLDCFSGGTMRNGRFEIPDSMFFSNANDLSLQLIIAVTQFMYLLYQSQIWKRILGAGAMLAALVFMFQTAARGAFLAILVVACVGFLFGKSRVRLLVAALPVTLIALWLVPGSIFHRLTLITVSLDSADISDSQDESAVASQIQRIDLLRQSVTYALTHPIFGVGPDEFAVAVYGDSVKNGTRAPWLGTHNSYTQVASECGLPALVLYCGVIFISLRSNFRIYRRAAKYPELSDLSALAFCLFNSTLVYAICTFFFHIAYSSYLPGIAGMSIALRLATDPSLWARRAAPSARAMAPAR